MPRIGLISDTHGLLRPEALAALAGVDRILHAGDVGRVDVLDALEGIAPVIAVSGNVDREPWAERLPVRVREEIHGVRFVMIHILDDLDVDPVASGTDVVVYGHSHVPSIEERNGVLYVNPGSAGPRRFGLPVTVAQIEIDHARPRARIVPLAPPDRVR